MRLHRFVRYLARGFDGDDPATPTEWRGGRTLLVLGLLLLAPPLSAVARHHGAPSMLASLALTVLAIATFVGVLWPLLAVRAANGRAFAVFALTAAVVSVLVVTALWAGPLEGMPACTGGDAGVHVWSGRQFIERGQNTYEGMATLYATVHWLTVFLRIDELQANRIAHLLSVSASFSLGVVAASARPDDEPRRSRVALLVTTLCQLVPAAFVALPLLHYYQCDGFFPQIFSLVPIALGLSAYTVPSRRSMRLVALVVMVAGCRYTYLLNLGDLLVVAVVALLFESRGAPAHAARVLLRVGAVVLLGGAVVVYQRLYAVRLVPGGFAHLPLWPEMLGLLALASAFAAVVLVTRHFGTRCPPRTERLAVVMAVLCGLPAVFLAAWLLSGAPSMYYAQKYGFVAMVLGSLSAPPIVASAVERLAASEKINASVARSALVLAGSLGLFALGASVSAYWPSLIGRMSGPPYTAVGPLRDRSVFRSIESTLGRESAHFGGLLTPRWPESEYTNTYFRLPNPGAVFNGGTVEAPQQCVFWYAPDSLPPTLFEAYSANARATIERLASAGPPSCETIAPRYAPGTTLSLCHRCMGGTERALPFTAPEQQGFHGIERGADGAPLRWTNGLGRVRFVGTAYEAGHVCMAHVTAIAGAPFELWLDDQRLGPGPHQALPDLSEGVEHELQIRSRTAVPASEGHSLDTRTLGVFVAGVTIACPER